MKSLVNKIETKLSSLIIRYNEIKEANKSLSEQNSLLEENISLQKKKIDDLNEKVRILNISKSIDVTETDLISTKKKIDEYVREIDKCIALLNK